MRTASTAKKGAGIGAEAPATINGLVRQLVHQVANGSAAPPTPGGVMLDVEMEGVRCLVVRVPTRLAVSLSPREREIARMVAKGYANKMIAKVLDISSWTVGTYLRRIFAKLSVSSRAAMVARLMEERPNGQGTLFLD
jgi:DNA-binding CsgD family transcriptional regulator